MRRRWFYFRKALREHAALSALTLVLLASAAFFWLGKQDLAGWGQRIFEKYGVQAAGSMMKAACPALVGGEGAMSFPQWVRETSPLFSFLAGLKTDEGDSWDPSYKRMTAESEGEGAGQGESQAESGSGEESNGLSSESYGDLEPAQPSEEGQMETAAALGQAEAIAEKPAGQTFILEKLADYDYLMQNFYSVHPTTTAGRDVMNAEKFLSMDFSLEKNSKEPQILIYHTHSQEEFSDYPENPEATIVGVGTYLAELLEKKGYGVIHDTNVYDLRDGKLDRSQAYTYALDGITGILQQNPSIEVVLDVHRDGVAEETHLVKEINGKPTAQIMLFNGMSQTPDGPIEYLPNPNRDANLGFSFQMQLKAAERFPGFTRKIYLKGLRYNEHVRARSALIEVGAQTNTYEEAKNAMEPLAEILDAVLSGT